MKNKRILYVLLGVFVVVCLTFVGCDRKENQKHPQKTDQEPSLYQLATEDGKWHVKFLQEGEEPTEEELKLQVTRVEEEKISVKLINESSEEKSFGDLVHFQVLLKGKWYDIPSKEELGVDKYSYPIPAGAERNKVTSLSSWGEWPEGHYRILLAGAAAEFDWVGNYPGIRPKASAELVAKLKPADWSEYGTSDEVQVELEYDSYAWETPYIAGFLINKSDDFIFAGHITLEYFYEGVWYRLPKEAPYDILMGTSRIRETGESLTGTWKSWYDFRFPLGTYRYCQTYQYGDNATSLVDTDYDMVAFAEFELKDEPDHPLYCDIQEQSFRKNKALKDNCVVLQRGEYYNLEAADSFIRKAVVGMPSQLRIVDLDKRIIKDVYMESVTKRGMKYRVDICDNENVTTQYFQYLSIYGERENAQIVTSCYSAYQHPFLAKIGEPFEWDQSVLFAYVEDEHWESMFDRVINKISYQLFASEEKEIMVYNQSGEGYISITEESLFDNKKESYVLLSVPKKQYAIDEVFYSDGDYPIYAFPAGENDLAILFQTADQEFYVNRYSGESGRINAIEWGEIEEIVRKIRE